jgi:hypothetical protein
VQGDTIGALNLYSRHSAAFDEYDRAVGAVLAAHAAIAMSAAHEHERAEQMEDRDGDRGSDGSRRDDPG